MKERHIRIGDTAPQFQATDVFGSPVHLSDFSQRKLLVVFLRYAGCPFCNLTIQRLTMEYPLLQKQGCDVIAFIESSPQAVIDNIYGQQVIKPQFPIVADQERRFYDLYEVQPSVKAAFSSIKDIPYWMQAVVGKGFRQKEVDGSFFTAPATFLISSGKQRILESVYSASFYDHATFTGIYERLTFDAA